MRFFNRVKFTTSTSGTGTITVGSASTGFRTPAQASVPDGALVRYVIEDPAGSANWETGWGKYTVSGTTLTRNVLQSSNADALLNLSGSGTVVRITELAEDLYNTGPDSPIMIIDDFLGGSQESGEIGQLKWTFTGVSITHANGVANHPGLVNSAYTGTAQTSYFALGAGNALTQFICGQVDEMVYNLNATYTADANANLRFGAANDPRFSSQNHGAFFERLQGDTDWYGAVMNGGSKTRTASPLISDGSANGSYHTWKIRRISSTSWGFSVDGGTEVLISSGNYPDDTDALQPFFNQYNASGANSNAFIIDYVHFRLLPQAR